MAPLPSNSTAVLFVDYSTCGHDHTVECRFGSTSNVGEAMAVVHEVWTIMSEYFRLVTITGARVRADGGVVTTPVTWAGSGTYGEGAGTEDESAQFISFQGRSLGGRRVKMTFFGSIIDKSANKYRIYAGADDIIEDCIEALDTGMSVPVAIDEGQPIWQNYANIGQNAYWQRKIR